ncbi:MAG: radical SAM protein, partial [Proteobacteria bacterium]|nr:radical SAM protein [Pseudomonadota bacterium]
MSAKLGFCGPCLIERHAEIRDRLDALHASVRTPFGLPAKTPRSQEGLVCDRCLNVCRIGLDRFGYCGLRKNEAGQLVGGDQDTGRVSWYLDPLPTNCVATWVCAGGTGAGHPRFAGRQGPQRGEFNLAVFYEACSFDCLFCQNWTFKRSANRPGTVTAAQLAAAVTPDTSCICYFGGDPGPQVVHSLAAARLAREAQSEKILRVCWETNGSVAPKLLDRMVDLALESGGTIKFDLKAVSNGLHHALTGARNRRTLRNFA